MICPFEGGVWSGSAIQSLHDKLLWSVDLIEGLSLLTLLPALSTLSLKILHHIIEYNKKFSNRGPEFIKGKIPLLCLQLLQL